MVSYKALNTAEETIITYICHAVRNIDFFQCAISKGIVADALQTIMQANMLKAATCECVIPDYR